MAVSAAEQYLLELINRARLDPLAEAARYAVTLNDGLPAGTIDGTAREVLAPSVLLERAAILHSAWMLETDTFSHTGADASDPGDRIVDADYALTGAWSWRENLAWSGTTGTLDLAAAIAVHHEGLYRSPGHRQNTFATDIREVGIAQIEGVFTQSDTEFNASMTTLNFARSGCDHFLTGVAYRDADADAFYSIGEGIEALSFAAAGQSVETGAAGGYGLSLSPQAGTDVVISQAGDILASLSVDLSVGNVKLDVMTATDSSQILALSGSAVLEAGIADAILLGVADLDLTGSVVANVLTGNAGRNALDGGAGNDQLFGHGGADQLEGGAGADLLDGGAGRAVLWDDLLQAGGASAMHADLLDGGAGHDTLLGGSGRDMLIGGTGNDLLTGGAGRDVFVFNAGVDRISDFDDNVDTLQLDGTALGLAEGISVADSLAAGQIIAGNTQLDFGGGNSLQIDGISDMTVLLDDVIIV